MWNTTGYGQHGHQLRWTYLVHSLPNVSDDVSIPLLTLLQPILLTNSLGAGGLFKIRAQPGYGFGDDIRVAMENFTIPFSF